MENALLYYLWLNSRLYPGSPSAKLLLENFPDSDSIFHAGSEDYKALDITKGDIARLCDKDLTDAKRYYEFCEKEHIGILTYDNPYYPGRLKAISNPPPVLYYRGKVELLDDYPCFAMVGTRSCSEHGFRTAYRIAYETASCGGVVINGLALGSDTACMKGALDAGGYAVGLLGCGIDRVYPSQNKELFCRLSRQGLILSEFAPFTRPDGRNFPVRNRVISALSIAAVIFEANAGSGALITASHALSQGRRIFAVPGEVGDDLYTGPLGLLKGGATLVTGASDILAEYSLKFPHRIITKGTPFVPPEAEQAAVEQAFSVLPPKKPVSKPQNASAYDPASDPAYSPAYDPASDSGKRQLPKPQHMKTPKHKYAYPEPKQEYAKPVSPSSRPTAEALRAKAPAAATQTPAPESESTSPGLDITMLSAEEQHILSFFEKFPVLTVDEIAAKGIKTDDVLSSLTLLELFGFIQSLPGGRYERLS